MPDPSPLILALSNQFRAQLIARERRAATSMVRFYGETWRRMQGDITRLTAQVDNLREAGEDVTREQILRMQRLKAIQAQTGMEMLRFAEFADGTISQGERIGIAAANRQAPQLVLAAFPPGSPIGATFSSLPAGAVESLVGVLQDGSPLLDLIQLRVGDGAAGFIDTMVSGLAAGWGPRRLAADLRASFGIGLSDALRISRTEQLRAYRTATLASYQSSGVVKGWTRQATLDSRTCMACVMLDGKVFSLNEPMDDHVQGRCAMIPITKSFRELGIDAPEPDFDRQLARDWFRDQDEATQQRMMGKGAFAAWRDGAFELENYPKRIPSDTWGDSWVPKPLKELAPEFQLTE